MMANVAKWLTHRIVAPAFVSSILIVRPISEDKVLNKGFFYL